MVFEWDADKCSANIIKHGIDFADACHIWHKERIDPYAQRTVNGEVRLVTLGRATADEIIIAVVYTTRENVVRIISARRARRYERKDYQDRFGCGI